MHSYHIMIKVEGEEVFEGGYQTLSGAISAADSERQANEEVFIFSGYESLTGFEVEDLVMSWEDDGWVPYENRGLTNENNMRIL